MKKYGFIKHSFSSFKVVIKTLILTILIVLSSCDEEEFLKEIPLDFYSPENSFVSYENFQSAVVNLYDRVRSDFYQGFSQDNGYRTFPSLAYSGTDLVFITSPLGTNADWSALLLPTNTSIVYQSAWLPAYRIIYDANVILGRVDEASTELTEEQRIKVKAETLFFRAFAYRLLANLHGGVPLVLEEITSPKRDYTRATRQEVYEQCAIDLKFAAENLPKIGETDDSRINNLVAYHLLSEIYISLEKWQDAIDAATIVIDDPATSLMLQRFGTRSNEPGDVYWDLFRQENQNRSSGNTESLWVLQYEFNLTGGASGARDQGFILNRMIVPRLWQAKVSNNDGSSATIIPHPNTDYYGRGSGHIRPSHYFFEGVWHKSGYSLDIRNSEFNIVRDFVVNNPASDHNGKWVLKDNLPIALKSLNDTTRNFFPVVAKAATPGRYPVELFHADQTVPGSLTNQARETLRDQYVFRLAETYLLRAEAHLGSNSAIKAAEDINLVRRRANAPEIDPSLVDIDYILDERLRELYFEELRLFTLTRLGKLVDRTKKFNPYVGNTYLPHNNLWPIPYDDIEKNTEAILEQNPGY